MSNASVRFAVAASADIVVVTFEDAPGDQVMSAEEVEMADAVALAIFRYMGLAPLGKDPVVESAAHRERIYRPRRRSL